MQRSIIDELLTYIFDGQSHMLSGSMAEWLASSRRFTTFANTCKNKIRKKVRTTLGQENLLDLQLELETAYLLLRERSLSVEYEPLHAEKTRRPDFAVTFTTSFTFMLEVTRVRTSSKIVSSVAPEQPIKTAPLEDRLADTICSKLDQLLIQRSNILLVGVDVLPPTQNDLRAFMRAMQQRVEGREPAFLQRYRFRDRSDFFHHFQRLSGVLVRGLVLKTGQSAIGWINPQAKHPLPGRVQTALYRSHTI